MKEINRQRRPLAVKLTRAMRHSDAQERWFEGDNDARDRYKNGFGSAVDGGEQRAYDVQSKQDNRWLGYVLLEVCPEDLGDETHVMVNTVFVWVRPSCRSQGVGKQVAGLAAKLVYDWVGNIDRKGDPNTWLINDASTGKNLVGQKYVARFQEVLEEQCTHGDLDLQFFTTQDN